MADSFKLNVGQVIQLQVLHKSGERVGPAVQADVDWVSDNTDVVTVDASGVMGATGSPTGTASATGVGAGDATITATVGAAVASYPVTVSGEPPGDIVIVHLV